MSVSMLSRTFGCVAVAFVLVACSDGSSTVVPDPNAADDGSVQLPQSDASLVPQPDASTPTDAATQDCGEFTGDARFTCSKDGNSRGKCVNGSPQIEDCPRGCLRETAPADDKCMGTTTAFSCTGTFGTEKAQDGDYYITSFGCWVDANKVVHTDPGDNCIPGCLSKAQSSLCKNMSGPQCEDNTDWYVADSARFGCLARMRVTNPKNGKKVIVTALDAGPACWVENNVQKALLDASGRVNEYLFGTQHGYSDKALVHVVEVDPATPLGPEP